MKELLLPMLLATIAATASAQPRCETRGPDTPVERLLKQRDLDWGRALVARDERLLNELLDDDFTLTNPSGGLTNKQNHIRDILQGNFVITSHEADDVCVRVYGDAAVVTARVRTVARNKVRDLSGNFRTVRVYAKKGDVWRLVAHQATRNAQQTHSEQVEGQRVPADTAAGTVEQEILALEREWMDGVVRRDAAILDRLMADDFVLLGERWNGQAELTTKQPWIRNSLTTIEGKSFGFDKVTVQGRGTTAVFHALLTFDATIGGKPWGGTVRVTDVWVKDGGRWRVVARHASRPSPPQPAR